MGQLLLLLAWVVGSYEVRYLPLQEGCSPSLRTFVVVPYEEVVPSCLEASCTVASSLIVVMVVLLSALLAALLPPSPVYMKS